MPNQIVHATEENVGDGLTKEELKIRKKQAAKAHGTLLQLIHSKSCHAQELRSFEGISHAPFPFQIQSRGGSNSLVALCRRFEDVF